jgi:hypothetical protein
MTTFAAVFLKRLYDEEEKSYFVEFLCACLQTSTGSGI